MTPEGYLDVGPNLEPYALNKNRVDLLLRATSRGLPANQKLRYYIADDDGQLPPGLVLNENTGLISGYVSDQLSLDFLASKVGGFDGEFYDSYPYDHVVFINNLVGGKPTSISKIYQFYVTVTDNISSARRKFRIRVDDPNSLRVDTTQIDSDTTEYRSNVGYLIPPVWQNTDLSLLPNPSNLGIIRANNNHVIDLQTYDPYPFVGPVTFDWDIITVNPEIRMLTNAEVNVIGIQTSNVVGQSAVIVSNAIGVPLAGMSLQLNTYVPFANDNIYTITKVEKYGSTGYKLTLNEPLLYTIPDLTTVYVGSLATKPEGLELDSEQGIIYGRIPYQPAYSRNFRFTIRITKTDQENGDTVSNNHIFNLTVKGDVSTSIEFISPSSLGTLKPGHISDIAVVANHTSDKLPISYSLTGGTLPPGLSLTPAGNITGTIPVTNPNTTLTQFFDEVNGIREFNTTFDIDTTTFDRVYNFNITAVDSYLLSAVSKDFTITLEGNNVTPYSDLYVKPLLPIAQRLYFRSLVENSSVFDINLLYRTDDPNFGVQSEVKMTIEYGLQRLNLDNYIPALAYYFKRRRYYFGEVKTATAIDSSGTALYDVVYVDVIDDQMIGNSISVAKSFTKTVNGEIVTYYPDSLANEQYALETLEITANSYISVDTELRPKFMQTLQAGTGTPLGFVKASILCYAIAGQGAQIVKNIKNSGFEFSAIDFEIDRVFVESLDLGLKYLVFGAGGTAAGFYIIVDDDTGDYAGQELDTEDGQPLSI